MKPRFRWKMSGQQPTGHYWHNSMCRRCRSGFEQQRIDKAQEWAGQRSKLRQDQAALAEAEQNYQALISEFQQSKQAELSAVEMKAASLIQEVRKAGQKTELQKLVSPIDGVVQQLAVHTVGGVVTPAQPLLMVVPQDHPVEVEAQLENRDIGFVREGQPVELKIETFPFTLYGTIPGKVLTVSGDAVPLDKDKGGLVYVSRVSMDRATMQVEGKQIHLTPGTVADGGDQDRTAAGDRIFAEPPIEVHEREFAGAVGALLRRRSRNEPL
ncbi:MAG: HlyD family efflux transporter periplasmic adaptor subunit [Nitrospira sp.]|nr:HlyD family efflux transporter periplasmic adaptor subunit [Nitrospira sp.]